MTNDEINERIAAITGFHDKVGLKKRGLWWSPNDRGYTSSEYLAGRYTLEQANERAHPDGEPVTIHKFTTPDYAGDLNACRQFEEMIEMSSDQEIQNYVMDLEAAAKATGSGWNWRAFRLARATPLQRCEAFLRMKGRWE